MSTTAGAALDVGPADEQMPATSFAAKSNVAASPHIAGVMQGAIQGPELEVISQLAEIVSGTVTTGNTDAGSASCLYRTAE